MSKNFSTWSIDEGLVLSGYHKKLKTMKKKFFILFKETKNNVARLEYYDTERKFKQGAAPKRVIKLKNCLNINRRLDTKHNFVLALTTKDGGFGIVLENENEMCKWMEVLMSLQRCDANPHFDHVWQVTIQKKDLAEEKGITGNYHVCLSPKSLTFIRIGSEKNSNGETRMPSVEVLLTTIRRCGDSSCLFYLDFGRQSVIGPGELWMETEDSLIAKNMHEMIKEAMSAKNESISNLHLINSMQSKIDTNTEPMRKRSSSANEASKPINVLQKRPTQVEHKTNYSPQTNLQYFGRERCDSLPTRNRTSSECSNQSYNTNTNSIHTIRSNAILGLRPHSYQQRHTSNSPPMSTPIGCSESEESSVSIDEPDDNGSFIPYRFNSRSSEGVIPEENSDDLIISENKYNELNYKTDVDHSQDSYISMAPVKSSKEIVDKNSHLRHINSLEESKCVSSFCLQNRGTQGSHFDFPEYASDKLGKTAENDVDQLCERPTRAYSIGSKVEHNKINKRIGNTNETEQSAIRVRAFSVGSRAKIPRCDLQRGVLFSKSRIESQNSNSNNNISFVNEVPTYKQTLNINSTREKKSTSAPILIHKSQNNVDRMSDLMEIDFSKSSNNTYNRIHLSSKALQFPTQKPVLSSIRSHIRNCNAAGATSMFSGHEIESAKFGGSSLDSQLVNIVAKTDNGYLEMKPVGQTLQTSKNTTNSINFYKSAVNNCNEYSSAVKPKIFDSCEGTEQSLSNMQTTVLSNKDVERCSVSKSEISTPKTPPISIPPPTIPSGQHIINQNYCNITAEHTLNRINEGNTKSQSDIAHVTVVNSNLSNKFSQFSINGPPNVKKSSNKDDYINLENPTIGTCPTPRASNHSSWKKSNSRNFKRDCSDIGKLKHSVSDEDYIQNLNKADKSLTQSNEAGYKILQIKSDSSLQSNAKSIHRQTSISKESHPLKTEQQDQHIKQNMKNSLLSSPKVSGDSSTSSPSPQNVLTEPWQSNTTAIDKTINTPNSKTINAQLNMTSRPPSVTSEHQNEMNYASLDLPQCSSENHTMAIKKEITAESAPLTSITPVMNTSYAKIDFEHSDSSSSSSKVFNM